MSRNFFKELGKEDFDPSKIQGTWFEMFRDKMTYWELTGKCNHLTAKLSKSVTTTPITIQKVNIRDTQGLSLANTSTTSDVKLEKKIEPKEGYV